MAASKKNNKTKDTVSKVLSQAKESLKVLEALEKETLSQIKNAKNLVKMPNTNERILSSLRKLGVATQAEVDELKARIEALEGQASATRSTTQTPSPELNA